MRNLKEKDIKVLVNLITRYYKLYKGEKFEDIELWGCMSGNEASMSLKKGLIVSDCDKKDFIFFFKPTQRTIDLYIKPFVDKIFVDVTSNHFEYDCDVIMRELVLKVDSVEALGDFIKKDKDFLGTCKKYHGTIMFDSAFNYAFNETIAEINENISSFILLKEYKDYAWLKTKKYVFNLDEIYSYFKDMVKEFEEELLTEK